ncbi:LytR/AlgR family response regulator transcription factor [Lacticaseibacillus manihotivorans]|uniref:Response regulator of the LytR AlgR family protein n=3 Tax=Lacticaseibacillus manihotivorans TaxID=88233 RepID=A0A0R1R596_9LACO|nr:LytTR family DNA-binding domain-containing protein [Lacticaseibacillus manihotivorans]KRL51932.1 response regulator of the LytR AlgR family protein [Lacticaseibacillus manihotivorans DSM 13343 = JCM 12514]QFQ92849.1 response regulator [Lacticaseibacillus manihotivorans]
MLNIYLLEDSDQQRAAYVQQVQTTCMIEGLDAQLQLATGDAQTLLDAQAPEDSLYLLDIELSGQALSGIDVAKAIRAKSLSAEIIFITSHPEAALLILTNQITPMDLIQKNADTLPRIHQALIAAAKRHAQRLLHTPQLFAYTQGGQVNALPLDSVIALQVSASDSETIELTATNEIASFRGNLTAINAKYPTLFRCHKSCLINLDQLKQVDTKNRLAIMQNGAKIDVSFRKLATLRQLLEGAHA